MTAPLLARLYMHFARIGGNKEIRGKVNLNHLSGISEKLKRKFDETKKKAKAEKIIQVIACIFSDEVQPTLDKLGESLNRIGGKKTEEEIRMDVQEEEMEKLNVYLERIGNILAGIPVKSMTVPLFAELQKHLANIRVWDILLLLRFSYVLLRFDE